jgi:hypothetical protein
MRGQWISDLGVLLAWLLAEHAAAVARRCRTREETMHDKAFEVKPVVRYEGAKYPAAPGPDDSPSEERTHPVVLLVTLLLLVGITVGLVGCYMRTDYVPETPGIDGGPDGDPPEPDGDVPEPVCDDGEVRCLDTTTAQTCDDGAWVTEDCINYCAGGESESERLWYSGDAYCDASAEEPCVCNYDIEGGVMAECTPGDIMCADDFTLGTCDDGYSYSYQDCNEYCLESFGPEYVSYGCDAAAEDPCECDYDMLEGDPAICTPGDVECWDDTTLAVCNDFYYFDDVACANYCVSMFGPDYVSLGCDAALEDPCECAAPGSDSGSGS